MSLVQPKEFAQRFRLTREVHDPTHFYKKSYYRDILHRRNVFAFTYSFLSEEDCFETVDKAVDLYVPELTVQLLAYTIFYDHTEGTHKVHLLYNECQTLEQLVYEENSARLRLLSLGETIYINLRVSKLLVKLSELETYHGNIDEEHIFIDQDWKVRLLLLPHQDTNTMRIVKYRSQIPLQSCSSLLSPESMSIVNGSLKVPKDFSEYRAGIKSDLFSLSLMTLRLLSPRAMRQGYNLETLTIDLHRLHILIDTLGTFVDSSFAGILKQSLSFDPEFRPEPVFLVDEILATHKNLPPNLYQVQQRPFELDPTEHDDHPRPSDTNRSLSTLVLTGVSSPLDQSNLNDSMIQHRKPLLKSIGNVHPPTKKPKTESTEDIERLRQQCLHFLENKLFDNVPHSRRREFSDPSGNRHLIKTLFDGIEIGFILYANKDVYFGFTEDSMPGDIGLMFLSNLEVYVGQFKDGRLHGKGTLYMQGSRSFEGDWCYNQMHGNQLLVDPAVGAPVWCVFNSGVLISTNEASSNKAATSLEDFYFKDFKTTDVVKEIYHDYIAQMLAGEGANKALPSNYDRKPAGRALRLKKMYQAFMGGNQSLDQNDLERYPYDNQTEDDGQEPGRTPRTPARQSVNPPATSPNSRSGQASRRKPSSTKSAQKHPSIVERQYINSNRKEKEYEYLGRERFKTDAHQIAKVLLNTPNKEYTAPRFYEDVKHISPKQETLIEAGLDRKFYGVDPVGRYYSPENLPNPSKTDPPRSPPQHRDPTDSRRPIAPQPAPPVERSSQNERSFVDFNKYADLTSNPPKPLNSPQRPEKIPRLDAKRSEVPLPPHRGELDSLEAPLKKSLTDRSLRPYDQVSFNLPSENQSDVSQEEAPAVSKPRTKKPKSKTPKKRDPEVKQVTPQKKTTDTTDALARKQPKVGQRGSRSSSKQARQSRDSKTSDKKEKSRAFPARRKLKSKSPNPQKDKLDRPSKVKPGEDPPSDRSLLLPYSNFVDLPADLFVSRPDEGFSGYGWAEFSSGDRFYGYFTAGTPNGLGTIYPKSGGSVPGRWRDGKLL